MRPSGVCHSRGRDGHFPGGACRPTRLLGSPSALTPRSKLQVLAYATLVECVLWAERHRQEQGQEAGRLSGGLADPWSLSFRVWQGGG